MPAIKRFARALGSIIRRNHLHPAIMAGARISHWYLRNYWNQQHWNMRTNGELLLLRTLAAYRKSSKSLTVLDVGANTGDYTKLVRDTIPNSAIHCFEIMSSTCETLAANLAGMENIVINEFGLSNSDAFLEVAYTRENDCEARVLSCHTGAVTQVATCRVQTGDNYLAEQNLEEVDLLKIDTEGHEIAVMEGFERALDESRIRVIQFEYGTPWIASGRFLAEAYALLEPAGFRIGRLYPDGVFVKSYKRAKDDHFRMGNYVAIHDRCAPLLAELNLNTRRSRKTLGSPMH